MTDFPTFQQYLPQVLRFGIPSLDELFGSEVVQARWPKAKNGRKHPPLPPEGFTEVKGLRLRTDKKDQNLPLSLCIAGTDGTGKSILALHLASRYAADCARWALAAACHNSAPRHVPKVIYISTDLTASRAESVWNSFSLSVPNLRKAPFGHPNRKATDEDIKRLKPLKIGMAPYDAGTLEAMAEEPLHRELGQFLTAPPNMKTLEIAFLDLAESTAGDDWGLVNRLIGSLHKINDATEPRHLVIIDAVEGLEVMSGDRDLFGELRTRRSRIAQVIRSARKKCHLCFVLEDSGEEERLPEEYVTDAVLRLRSTAVDNYARRTAEVVKARGQQCVRGQHIYVIRDGKGALRGGLNKKPGTYTEDDFHPDDPFNGSAMSEIGSLIKPQGYVQVFRSLHSFSRDVMNAIPEQVAGMGKEPVLKFHTPKFGALMKKEVEGDGRGLACGLVTALLGDDATHKGRIGRAFLAGAFEPWDQFPEQAVVLITSNTMSKETLIQKLPWHWNHFHDYAKDLAGRLSEDHFGKCQKDAWQSIDPSSQNEFPSLSEYLPELTLSQQHLVVCRQLEAHSQNSAGLFTIIRRCVERAISNLADADRVCIFGAENKRKTFPKTIKTPSKELLDSVKQQHNSEGEGSGKSPTVADRLVWLFGKDKAAENWTGGMEEPDWLTEALEPNNREWYQRKWQAPRVRVVIDDWTVIQEMYPEVARDPVFLPFLIRYLERVGVSALFIGSQSGHSDGVAISERDRELRSLVRHHVYTWRVHFYGQEKVAISAIPPMEDYLDSVVREIGPVPSEKCRKRIEVVKSGKPQGKGAEQNNERLWIDPHFELYLGLDKAEPKPVPLSIQLFSQAPGFQEYVAHKNRLLASLFHPARGQAEIITTQDPDRYAALRDFALYAGEIHRDDTTILQVDEYWPSEPQATGKIGSESSLREDGYLQKRTFRGKPSEADKIQHNDPYGTYIPTDVMQAVQNGAGKTWKKMDFFDVPDVAENPPGQASKNDPREEDPGAADETMSGWNEEAMRHPEFVPYFWDFGFLLLRDEEWSDLNAWLGNSSPSGESNTEQKKLLKTLSLLGLDRTKQEKPVSWKDFLTFARQAADLASDKKGHRVPAFDVDMQGAQSFACLVLEIWASEIGQLPSKDPGGSLLCCQLKKYRSPHDRESVRKKSLRSILGRVVDEGKVLNNTDEREALFRTFLMLGAVLDPADFLDEWGQFKHRKVNNAAVAVRHWYSTGSVVWRETESTGIVKPYRLPGNYCTRGDWFLWVSPESRSLRLGHHAIDLFCRRSGNLTRLQLGLGLPVRRLDAPLGNANASAGESDVITSDIFKTAMATYDDKGKRRSMKYGEVRKLGCTDEDKDFQWLWRSHIKAYARHSNTFEKWLARIFCHWGSWLEMDGARAAQGLEKLKDIGSEPVHLVLPKAWREFIEECNALEMELPASDSAKSPQNPKTYPK